MSTSSLFPNGLANSSGLVGKYFTEHLGVSITARFDERLDPWKGPMAGASLQDYYETDKRNNFARGWTTEVNNGAQWPLSVALKFPGWGRSHQAKMKHHFGHSIGLATVGDQLPDIRNHVTLDPIEKDHRGLPVPRLLNEPRENDLEMLKVIPRRLHEILEAAGASDISESVYTPGASSHYLGTCRMGTDPRSSVVNAWCRTHDVSNLYIGDSSVFVTGAAVNPTLTIAAIATRTAEGMVAAFKRHEL
jgi:choline dehydrogenase-like flavoprotein